MDDVPISDGGKGSSNLRLRRDVQNDRPKAAAGHSRIRNTKIVVDALFVKLRRHGQIVAELRHTGRALGSVAAQDDDGVLVHVGSFIRQPFFRLRQIVKDLRRSAMVHQPLGRGAALDDAAIRSEVSLENAHSTDRADGVGNRADHIAVVRIIDILEVFADRFAVDRHAAQIELSLQLLHHRRHAACVMERRADRVRSVRLDVHEQRGIVADGVKLHQIDVKARTVHDRFEVNEKVRRAAACHQHTNGVSNGRRRNDIMYAEIFCNHFHNASAGFLCHTHFFRRHTQTRCAARQRHAHRLGKRLAGVRCSHNRARANRAVQAARAVHHLLPGEFARDIAVIELESIRAAAERLALVASGQHCAAGQEDRGLVDGCRRHQLCGNIFVAAANQDNAVKRMARHQLFCFD